MPLPTYNPLTLQECLEPIIRQIFYQAVLKDQSETVHYIKQNWHTAETRLIHKYTRISQKKLAMKKRKCHKTCLVRKAVEEDNPLDSLMKMRLHFPPYMPLCFQTGIIQACLGRWDLFKLILPCNNQIFHPLNNQIQWMKYHFAGDSLLQIAANQNNTEMIETLIIWYGLPNKDLKKAMSRTLFKAIDRGQTEVARRLIHLSAWNAYELVPITRMINIALKKRHYETVNVLETIRPVFTLHHFPTHWSFQQQ